MNDMQLSERPEEPIYIISSELLFQCRCSSQSNQASSHQKHQSGYLSVDVQVVLIQSRIISSESLLSLFQYRCSSTSNLSKHHLSVDVPIYPSIISVWMFQSIRSRIISSESLSQCRCSTQSNPFTHHLINQVIPV